MKKLLLTLSCLAIFGIAMPQEHHWTPITGTQYNMIVNGIIFIDGIEQMSSALEVGAFCGDECRASVFAAFFPPTEQYVASMTVVSDQVSGETITFRLYNHDTDEILDGTSTVVFENLTSVGELGTWFPLEFFSSQTSFLITATSNPEQGGTVNGGGTYNEGDTCTLTASANEGYTFVNWTKEGEPVSEALVYSFTVTEDGDYVAHFNLNSYEISAMPNPIAGGVITGAGTYSHGDVVTLTVTPNPNYIFDNWTENGTVVSQDEAYSFVATGNRTLVANLTSLEVIGEQDGITVSIYPNPTSNKLTVEVDESDATLEIFNLDGVLIYKVKDCSNIIMVETSSWASGTYILRLTTKSSTGTRRFIKK